MSGTVIDPLARVAPGAQLGANVSIGPFCCVGKDVVLGDEVSLQSHVNIEGHTSIGARTRIHPFASIGSPPHDLGYKGEPTRVEIGADCVIREGVTINRATTKDQGVTTIGSHVFMMAYAHVAHDCVVGDQVVFANAATLGGHVQVGSFVFLGGLCAVHQHCRIGDYAMVGGLTGVKDDLIPFGMAFGANGVAADLIGVNVVGIRRRGFSKDDLLAVRACYQVLFHGEGAFAERRAAATLAWQAHSVAGRIIAFIEANDKRPLMMAAKRHAEVKSA